MVPGPVLPCHDGRAPEIYCAATTAALPAAGAAAFCHCQEDEYGDDAEAGPAAGVPSPPRARLVVEAAEDEYGDDGYGGEEDAGLDIEYF